MGVPAGWQLDGVAGREAGTDEQVESGLTTFLTTGDIVVDYISTDFLGKHLGTSRIEYYWGIVFGMAIQCLSIDYQVFPSFKHFHSTFLFRLLHTLQIKHLDHETHILPYLGHIKDLAIQDTRFPAYSVDIDLPCDHTLQKLDSRGSTCSWMVGQTFHTLKECTLCNWDVSSEGLSVYKGVQVDMPACTKLEWAGSALAYTLFSHPNVQILQLYHLARPNEAFLKSLHNSLSNCLYLQELEIRIQYCSGLDSLIQFVFCDAQEQGVWCKIRSVELSFTDCDREQDTIFNEMVGQTQQYKKCWKDLTVSKRGHQTLIINSKWRCLTSGNVILKATM
jgi:hypothetical protein